MSSLVAYEDSGSEDESSASVQTGSCEQSQDVVLHSNSKVTPRAQGFHPDPDWTLLEHHGTISERSSSSLHPLPHPHFDQRMTYCSSRAAQHKHYGDTAALLSLPATQEKMAPLQSLPHRPQSFGEGLNQAKRHHSVPSGIRPYVPKRQRLATSVETCDPKLSAEQVPGNRAGESQVLLDVSARVKPYLTQKPDAAGIPRRLLMRLGGHQGPVNTVQWCPVPHLSHLLLSASMDRTFKVMTAPTRVSLSSQMLCIDT